MTVGRRFAVVVAGGQGTRMNNEVPKQFIEISGKPVLVYTLESFFRADVDVVILVMAKITSNGGQASKNNGYPNIPYK